MLSTLKREGNPDWRPNRAAIEETELVQECLLGREDAWCGLIDKYRNLIFSIPIRCGLSREDSSEVFQDVCLILFRELRRIREPRALPAWLIKITWQRSRHLRERQMRQWHVEARTEGEPANAGDQPPEELFNEIERQQAVREALTQLTDRCKSLVEMLFFTTPAVPYEEAARRLGVATGSVGFIRMRCLRRLRRQLEERGVA